MPLPILRLTAAALLLCGATAHAGDKAAAAQETPAAAQAPAGTQTTQPTPQESDIASAAAANAADSRADSEAAAWRQAQQLILVTTPDWDADHGELRTFVRKGNAWKATGRGIRVSLGRAGSAWGLGLHGEHAGPRKREGDGRSPAGVFRLGTAFGYAQSQRTALPYAAMQATHHCVDVTSSPLYNRIVDTREVGEAAVQGSTEPMRRDLHAGGDVRYKTGFVIDHNAAALPGGGSCIFAHLWRETGEATSGCTAMDEAAMQRLLRWLDPKQMPVFVLLPQAEYAKLAAAWQLPPPSTH